MSADFSREALESVLGAEALARAEALGRSAPPPSPELVDRVRRIFARVDRAKARSTDQVTVSAQSRAA